MERDLAREYADHCVNMYDKRLHDGAPESELQYWAGCEDGSRKTLKLMGWTPVDKSLPEDDRWVLMSFENLPLPDVGYLETFEDGSRAWTNGQEKTLLSRGFIVNAWMELPKRYEKDELVSGETIQCHDEEDLQAYQKACKRAGVETDRLYEMHGEKGFWLRVR